MQDGVCRKHEDLIGMWKWVLGTIGLGTLAMAGLIYSEATIIHGNQKDIKDHISAGLTEIKVSLASLGTQVDVNTKRLDVLEEKEREEPHHDEPRGKTR